MVNKKSPLISIYIPTRNRFEMLKRALASCFSQTYSNFEILICDDASTDETQQAMLDLAARDNRVKYLRNSKQSGACVTRNLGIFSADGEYITGLDDDDEFTKDRLEVFLNNWKDQYSFICSNFVDQYSKDVRKVYYKNNKITHKLNDLLLMNHASNQIFTRTERLQSVGGFQIDIRRYQDWDTWIKLCHKYGDFIRIPEVLYIMHHDHEILTPRVSNSVTTATAMEDLFYRNKHLYNRQTELIFKSNIKLINGTYTINDAFFNLMAKKSLLPIFQYIKQLMRHGFLLIFKSKSLQ